MAKAEKKVTLGKPELVEMLATKGQSKKEAQETLNDVLAAITAPLAKGNDLNIIGFGKFKVRHKPADAGRNPLNGETLQIAASNRVSFSVGTSLKSAVNKWLLYRLKALMTGLSKKLLRITSKAAAQNCLKGRPLTTQTGHLAFNCYVGEHK